MANDLGFEFDTSSERKQVQELSNSLDTLMASVVKLNNTDLNKLKSQMASLAAGESEVVRAMAKQGAAVEDALTKMLAAKAKLRSEGPSAAGLFTGAVKKTEEELKLLKQMLVTGGIELQEIQKSLDRNRLVNASKTALDEARAVGAAYSSITARAGAGSTKNSTALMAQMLFPTKEQFAEATAEAAARAKVALALFRELSGKDVGLRDLSGAVRADSVLVQAELSRFYSQLEVDGQRIASAWARLGTLATKDNGMRLLASNMHQDATLIQAEMAKFYTQIELDSVRLSEALARRGALATKDNGLRLLASNMHQDSALVQSEMNKFYTQLEMDSARVAGLLARRGSLATRDNGMRLLSSEMHKDNVLIQAELAKYYTSLEAAGRLKEQIRQRLSTGNVGVTQSVAPRMTVDLQASQYKEAMGAMKAYYSEMEQPISRGIFARLNDWLRGTKSNSDIAGTAFRGLAVDSKDLHSGLRGLASGFNAMWLTWGNILPLLAGAGISHAVGQVGKLGASVANTMTIIEVLGGNTKAEMAGLNEELLRLGRSGPQGPLQIAESMRVLSLAGLKANEILAVTQTVLNFSVSGTTELKTAADTLVSISTAFAMGAAGFSRVADVVSKAAAESKSSVESFSSAMKTASVINAQYGVSLEDTATAIATLSQLGIEGTAAGTALRNMYADLSGRSSKVAKVLKEQGIEMRTATGEFKPMMTVIAELNDKLNKLDGLSQKNLMQSLLSERGAKGIVEMLRLINTEAEGMGKGLSNALVQMRTSIEDSYGFSAIAAAKLSQTVENQFKSVKATMATGMVEAYQAMEPGLYLIANSLKKTFSSPEFISSLTSLVSMVAQLASSFVTLGGFIVEHAGAVAIATAAYGALRLAMVRTATASTAAAAASAAGAATEAAATAAKTAGLLGMARMIPGIGLAVTALTGAWLAYDFWRSKSKDTDKEAADLYTSNVVKTLSDQADRLEKINKLRMTGLSLTEAQSRLDAGEATKKVGIGSGSYDKLRAKEEKAWNDYNQASTGGAGKTSYGKQRLTNLKTEAEQASKEASAAFMQAGKDMAAVNAQAERMAAAERTSAKITSDSIEARNKELQSKFGTGTFAAPSGAAKKTDIEKAEEKAQREAEAILKTSEEYLAASKAEAESTSNLTAVEKARIKTLTDINLLENGKVKLTKEANEAISRARANADKAVAYDVEQTAQKSLAKAVEETRKVLDAAKESSRSFWQKDDNAQAALAANNAMTIAMENMTERERTVYKARTDATNEYMKVLDPLHVKMAAAIADKEALEKKAAAVDYTSGTSSGAFARMGPELQELEARISALNQLIEAEKREAANRAEIRSQTAGSELDKANAAKADSSFGPAAMRAMDDYLTKNKDVAGATEKVFTEAFSGMEDALTSFVMTGKLSFGSLVQSIISGLIRIMVQQSMMAMFKSSGSGGSLWGSAINLGMSLFGGGSTTGTGTGLALQSSEWGSASSVPQFDVGTNNVPYDMIAKVHKGEKITPASENPHSNPYKKSEKEGSDRPITVIQNFTVGDVATVSMVKQAVTNSEKRIASAVMRSKTYGGALS